MFAANTSLSTLALNGTTSINASGEQSTVIGNLQVALTDYSWSVPSVYNLNRVSEFASVPNGADDFVGTVALAVTAVPEQLGLSLPAPGTAFVMMRRVGQILVIAAVSISTPKCANVCPINSSAGSWGWPTGCRLIARPQTPRKKCSELISPAFSPSSPMLKFSSSNSMDMTP